MSVDKYFQSRLESINSEDISSDEEKMLSYGQMEYFISRRLLSKKFRKNFLNDDTRKQVTDKVALSISRNKPIYLIFAFGGYKNHWVDDIHPRVGWAEFLHLIYITQLLTPIAKYYEPGVFLEYESECEAGIYHNNQSKADVDAYTDSFKELLKFMKPYVIENFNFNYRTLPEQYDTDKFFERVQKLVPAKTEELRKDLEKEDIQRGVERALFNLKIKGKIDLSDKSDAQLSEIALKSLAFNHLFLDEDYAIREEYFNGDERISMVGAYTSAEENPDNWIAINSCAKSNNAFWTSKGVLMKEEEGYVDDIVGPKVYQNLKKSIEMTPVGLFSGSLNYLTRIPVVKGE